jgi:hypothetical protein
MARLNEKVELEIGVPIAVVFAYETGRLCSKRWPGAEDCYARQTKDGRILFVDAAEEMRLQKMVRAGQPVILCREKTTAGSKYLTIKSPAPVLKGPLGIVNGRTIPDTKYAKSETPAPVFPDCEPSMNGPAPTEPISKPDSQTLITRCMVAAVDAAAKATAHGQKIGFPVTFGAPEIEAIAVTLYIRAQEALGGYRKPNGQARSHHNGNAAQRA